VWKCVVNQQGNPVVSVVNLGKEPATLELKFRASGAAAVATDLLTGLPVASRPTLKPFGVLFVELTEGER